jgi:hypothetical protein
MDPDPAKSFRSLRIRIWIRIHNTGVWYIYEYLSQIYPNTCNRLSQISKTLCCYTFYLFALSDYSTDIDEKHFALEISYPWLDTKFSETFASSPNISCFSSMLTKATWIRVTLIIKWDNTKYLLVDVQKCVKFCTFFTCKLLEKKLLKKFRAAFICEISRHYC